jgi:hypothetical protein
MSMIGGRSWAKSGAGEWLTQIRKAMTRVEVFIGAS